MASQVILQWLGVMYHRYFAGYMPAELAKKPRGFERAAR